VGTICLARMWLGSRSGGCGSLFFVRRPARAELKAIFTIGGVIRVVQLFTVNWTAVIQGYTWISASALVTIGICIYLILPRIWWSSYPKPES